ncbi:MAG: class I tRNA ligase family protein, partial [Patescibacteria group bacterium]
WLPVDWYNGAMEHVTLHLLYSRFWHKFLFDLKLVPTNEPYKKRTAHGLILAEGGVKMSKSKGNVINPDELVERFGADSLRVYEMFMGPFDQAIVWNTDGMVGAKRFLEKVWRISEKFQAPSSKFQTNFPDCKAIEDHRFRSERNRDKFQILINQTIKKVTEDIETMRFNTAISALMILTNEMDKMEKVAREDFEILLRLLAPFAPHITEELWTEIGNKKSIHLAPWPKYDVAKIQEASVKIVIQVNGKARSALEISRDLPQIEVEKQAAILPGIAKWLNGKSVKKIIFVPNRLLNFVVA